MKIIDILNKIANGEEVPKKIKYDARIMEYDHNKQDYNGYYSNGNGNWLFQYLFDKCRDTKHFINDEVEIIEEKPEPIEELKLVSFEEFKTMTPGERYRVTIAEYDRINKLIKAVNYLLEKDNNG